MSAHRDRLAVVGALVCFLFAVLNLVFLVIGFSNGEFFWWSALAAVWTAGCGMFCWSQS